MGWRVRSSEPFDEHQPGFALGRGAVEFALGRGNAFGVLETIVVAEQAEIHVSRVHFRQIEFIGPTTGGRHILEQEHVEEAAQQRVMVHEVADGPAFGSQFLLHGADKDASDGSWLLAASSHPGRTGSIRKIPPGGSIARSNCPDTATS